MLLAYAPDRIAKDIGTDRQLFIDDDVVAVVKNVTRRFHHPVKHPDNPLIENDQPWEVVPYFRSCSFNVLRDPEDGLFKCWYEDYHNYWGSKGVPRLGSRIYFAQSTDGITWEKPLLGRHAIDGRDTHTIIVSPDANDESTLFPSIMLDPIETDHSRRFKKVHVYRVGRRGMGLGLATSGNGLDWSRHPASPIIPEWAADCQVLTYDELDEKYVLWGRYGDSAGEAWHPEFDHWFSPVWPSQPEGVWGTRRRVWRLESQDLVNWSTAELIFEPGPADNLDDGHYSFVPWRAGEMHLGILNVLHTVDDTLDMYLLRSRDGHSWHRFTEHRPFVPRGPEGAYDSLDNETTVQPLVVGDELWFYYGGNSVHHDWWIIGSGQGLDVPEVHDPSIAANGHHLCLATLRYDGYVSLDATVREGYVETKPVKPTAGQLFINARCEPGGYVEAEVMDPFNDVWPGFGRTDCQRFEGDSISHNLTWSGGAPGDLRGGIKLRFHLRRAELYSFGFGGE